MQRMQDGDFYDIWYLLEEHGMDADFYVSEFEAKCKSKETYLHFGISSNESGAETKPLEAITYSCGIVRLPHTKPR